MAKKSFMITCKDYFGFKSGQNLKEFSNEMREVDMKFRAEIYAYFQRTGVDCEAPTMPLKLKVNV